MKAQLLVQDMLWGPFTRWGQRATGTRSVASRQRTWGAFGRLGPYASMGSSGSA